MNKMLFVQRCNGFTLLLVAFFAACQPAASKQSKVESPRTVASNAPVSFDARALDEYLEKAWKEENIVPAKACDDAQFLRRTYIDVVGVIPKPEVVEAFLADTKPDKRARLVDSLLESPLYSEHWATY